MPTAKSNQIHTAKLSLSEEFRIGPDEITCESFGRIGIFEDSTYRLTLDVIRPYTESILKDLSSVKYPIYFATTIKTQICPDWTLLHEYRPANDERKANAETNSAGTIIGYGSLKVTDGKERWKIFNVAYVPEAKLNMINPDLFLFSDSDSVFIKKSGIYHSSLGRIGVSEGSSTRLFRSTLGVIPPINHANHGSRK